MKIKSIISVTVAIATASIASVQANTKYSNLTEKLYVGFGYDIISADYSVPGLDLSANFGVFKTKIGYELHEYLDIEAQFGIGIKDDSIDILGTPVEAEIDASAGIYLKPNYDIEKTDINIYGILGLTSGSVSASTAIGSVSDRQTDVSYGIGAQVAINEQISAYIEYISYVNKSDFSYDGIGIGITYQY